MEKKKDVKNQNNEQFCNMTKLRIQFWPPKFQNVVLIRKKKKKKNWLPMT